MCIKTLASRKDVRFNIEKMVRKKLIARTLRSLTSLIPIPKGRKRIR